MSKALLLRFRGNRRSCSNTSVGWFASQTNARHPDAELMACPAGVPRPIKLQICRNNAIAGGLRSKVAVSSKQPAACTAPPESVGTNGAEQGGGKERTASLCSLSLCACVWPGLKGTYQCAPLVRYAPFSLAQLAATLPRSPRGSVEAGCSMAVFFCDLVFFFKKITFKFLD